jgi:hypothetical protein
MNTPEIPELSFLLRRATGTHCHSKYTRKINFAEGLDKIGFWGYNKSSYPCGEYLASSCDTGVQVEMFIRMERGEEIACPIDKNKG